nr:MAG TPA: hypothetical protein [Caudoviricetes sp.]
MEMDGDEPSSPYVVIIWVVGVATNISLKH